MAQSSPAEPSQPSPIFARAVERFNTILTEKQKRQFKACSLEDVQKTALELQKRRENPKALRNMARLQAFLEGMDEYRKVVQAFLNCTPFLGYAWGPIQFALLATDTWVRSHDIILDAYADIGERLVAFTRYRTLFEEKVDMRRVLELYYCDIIDFHYHATKFLNNPKWKTFLESFWKSFDSKFQRILSSLSRHKDLLESEKGTIAIAEILRLREADETHFQEIYRLENKRRIAELIEKIQGANILSDQRAASYQRQDTASGHWILRHGQFIEWGRHWSDKQRLFISGTPGAGKTILASFIIEHLTEQRDSNVVYFYCKHSESGKNTFEDILRSITAQLVARDTMLSAHLCEKLASIDPSSISASIEEATIDAIQSQGRLTIVVDGVDEMPETEAKRTLDWLQKIQPDDCRLLWLGQRTDALLSCLSSTRHLRLEHSEHLTDVKEYITELAGQLKQKFDLSTQTENTIASRIMNVAGSMFLYAKLVIENLLDQTSLRNLNKELQPDVFPVDLNAAYERVVSTIFESGPKKADAIKIVCWVSCAARPMRWREIQATFFVDPKLGLADFVQDRLRIGCKRLCGSLIDVDTGPEDQESDSILYLVHPTAKAYLTEHKYLDPDVQNRTMASFCLEYLLSGPFAQTNSTAEIENQTRSGYYALQDYAVGHWLDHLTNSEYAEAGDDESLTEKIVTLLREYDIPGAAGVLTASKTRDSMRDALSSIPSDTKSRNCWVLLEQRTSSIRGTVATELEQTSQNDASSACLRDMYGPLQFQCRKIGCQYFFNGFDSRENQIKHIQRHERPYRCAKETCPYHALGFETDKQLADHKTRYHSINESSIDFPRPSPRTDTLTKACQRGDLLAVQDLVSRGISLWESVWVGKPFLSAVQFNHREVCQYFIERQHSRSLFRYDHNSREALRYGLRHENLSVLRWLFEPQAQDGDSTKDLQYDSFFAVVKTELERNKLPLASFQFVVPYLRFRQLPRLLPPALEMKSNEYTNLLIEEIDQHTDFFNICGIIDLKVLDRVIEKGSIEICQRVLVSKGLRSTPTSLFKTSALLTIPRILERAASLPEKRIFDLVHAWVLQHGLATKTKLCLDAARADYGQCLQLLLRKHPDVLSSKRHGDSLLSIRTHDCFVPLVRALLGQPGYAINFPNLSGQTPLMIAVEHESTYFVKILLQDKNVDLEFRDKAGLTAAHIAAAKGNVEVMRLIIQREPSLPGPDYRGVSVEQAAIAGADNIDRYLSQIDRTGRKSFDFDCFCAIRTSDLEQIIEGSPQLQHEHRLVQYMIARREHLIE